MSRRPSTLLVPAATALVLVLPVVAGSPAVADAAPWRWPLGEHVVAGVFDRPDTTYSAGHRGVDLAGTDGEVVQAVAPGRVTFAGVVAGVGVVTIDHGRERSTYQPVDAAVHRGDTVRAGQRIGTLQAAGSHCADTCLHLGRLRGEEYLDPQDRLTSSSRFRLVDPDGPAPSPPFGGDGTLRRPVGGPITSPFGQRVHPITGIRKLHDGTDFGAPCGTPVHAAAPGVVVARPHSSAYGNRVVIRHAGGLRTSYNHLARQSVTTGQHVTPSTVVGRVGSTGLSTGCHLHFMVRKSGRVVDPMTYL